MRRLAIVVMLGLLAFGVRPVLAQQSLFAAVQGKVTDESGAGIPGAVVMVTHQESGIFRQVVHDPAVRWSVAGITLAAWLSYFLLAGRKG